MANFEIKIGKRTFLKDGTFFIIINKKNKRNIKVWRNLEKNAKD